MSEERGCLGRAFRAGCGCSFVVLLVAGGFFLHGLVTAPSESELSAAARETATSKLAALERSLRTRRPLETQFTEAELTLLAEQYLRGQGIEGDVAVTLPGDDLELSFRTTVEELERFVDLEQLPEWIGSDVRGALRVHPSVVDNEPFAGLESAALYGIPLPLSLLGTTAEENWFDRLDAEGAAAVRRIRSLEVKDQTLFLTIQ